MGDPPPSGIKHGDPLRTCRRRGVHCEHGSRRQPPAISRDTRLWISLRSCLEPTVPRPGHRDNKLNKFAWETAVLSRPPERSPAHPIASGCDARLGTLRAGSLCMNQDKKRLILLSGGLYVDRQSQKITCGLSGLRKDARVVHGCGALVVLSVCRKRGWDFQERGQCERQARTGPLAKNNRQLCNSDEASWSTIKGIPTSLRLIQVRLRSRILDAAVLPGLRGCSRCARMGGFT